MKEWRVWSTLNIWWMTCSDPQQMFVTVNCPAGKHVFNLCFCTFLHVLSNCVLSKKSWITYFHVSLHPQGCGASCGKCDCSGVKGAKVRFSFVNQSLCIFYHLFDIRPSCKVLFKFIAVTVFPMVWIMGSAQWDRLELGWKSSGWGSVTEQRPGRGTKISLN